MSAYSFVLTTGTGTYTFAAPNSPPDWSPHIAPENNTDQSPSTVCATLETWNLKNFTYVSATPGDNTTDFASLATALGGAVTSCVLKYGSNTIRSLDTTACESVSVRELGTRAKPGQWATHWTGDLVVVGRILRPNGNVVRIDQEFDFSADDTGLITQVWSGRIEVTPGSDVAEELAAYVPGALGAQYVIEPGGSPAFSYKITNHPTDTRATFRQVQREIGTALPSGATSWRQRSNVRDTADGRITTTSAQARGETVAAALRAAQSVKPSNGIALTITEQSDDALAASVEYVQRAPVPKVVSAFGKNTLVSVSWIVRIDGGGPSKSFELIPGYDPFELIDPTEPITVREHVIVRAVKVSTTDDIPLPDFILNPLFLQNRGCGESAPYRDPNLGEQRNADVWIREATRLYVIAKKEDLDVDAMFQKLASGPGWTGQADAVERLGLEFTTET